ncbi:Intraflagellar transport protein 74 [Gryllus bimaculatus]|nr:Intraflagellar transport protein 74 [Gryllus bimaculatus]
MESNLGKDAPDSPTHWKKDDRESIGNEGVNFATDGQTPPLKREDRPVSRRGMASRQSQNMEERPFTQQSGGRPVTSGRSSGYRTPSASVFASRGSVVPGTASRLTSAMRQSPVSRIGTAITFAGAQVSVVDRPITQQGLSGLRTGVRGPQMRQVQDKRYFEGLLQTKIRDLSNEITRLGKDIETQQREQATFLVYDKRVKEMAAELTGLRISR